MFFFWKFFNKCRDFGWISGLVFLRINSFADYSGWLTTWLTDSIAIWLTGRTKNCNHLKEILLYILVYTMYVTLLHSEIAEKISTDICSLYTLQHIITSFYDEELLTSWFQIIPLWLWVETKNVLCHLHSYNYWKSL